MSTYDSKIPSGWIELLKSIKYENYCGCNLASLILSKFFIIPSLVGVATGVIFAKYALTSPKLMFTLFELVNGISVGMIGFSLTGFAIFGMITNEKYLARLIEHTPTNSDTDLFDELTTNLFKMIYILFWTLLFSLFIRVVLGYQDYVNTTGIDPVVKTNFSIICGAYTCIGVLSGSLIGLSLVELHSFIGNILIFNKQSAYGTYLLNKKT